MTDTTIFHNPRCSKSRQALALLEEHGEKPSIREYLTSAPSIEKINFILEKLDIEPRDLMRKGESEYKDLHLNDKSLSKAELVKVMHENPRLIERPIVIKNDKVVIGRPPENVLTIL